MQAWNAVITFRSAEERAAYLPEEIANERGRGLQWNVPVPSEGQQPSDRSETAGESSGFGGNPAGVPEAQSTLWRGGCVACTALKYDMILLCESGLVAGLAGMGGWAGGWEEWMGWSDSGSLWVGRWAEMKTKGGKCTVGTWVRWWLVDVCVGSSR
jgi:hypothetical protein